MDDDRLIELSGRIAELERSIERLQTIEIGSGTWASYTPTITASSGTFTTVSGSGYYCQIGKLVFFYVSVVITDKGTGAGWIYITTPTDISGLHIVVGHENTTTGDMLQALVYDGLVRVVGYDGLTRIDSGRTYYLSGTYRAA